MKIIREQKARPFWKIAIIFWGLVLVCIGINALGGVIAEMLGLPVYLDCIGTMLAAVLGGYIPGIFVALAGSLINSLFDPDSISYSVLNVFIALIACHSYNRGLLKKKSGYLILILVYAFIGGFLGSFLTWIIYGFGSEQTTSFAVQFFYDTVGMSQLRAEIVGDYLVDVVDKFIQVIIFSIVIRILPDSFKKIFDIHAWKQSPLTSEALAVIRAKNSRSFSLRTKIFNALIISSGLIAIIAIVISVVMYTQSLRDFSSLQLITIPENALFHDSLKFFIREISLSVGLFILILAIFVYISEYEIILPLNTMAYIASSFDAEDRAVVNEVVDIFKNINISTGDEIENLYDAFFSMTQRNISYTDAIQKKNATILEMQNALIVVLANMVESRDHNTGDHIKTTAEYVEIIMDEMLKEGIYQDQMTTKFVADVYQSAPLHDIGKIAVSDVILNKPGKLTDDEFEIMKTHTTVGAQIIDQVIEALPDSDRGYLREARNLALYHHEKWNGQGYPYGLSGEEIPLSARIMAVADVFDALVSERSYKKPFPFDKAIAIIEESSGSHFDPLIAGAFLNAKDRIRSVTEKKEDNV